MRQDADGEKIIRKGIRESIASDSRELDVILVTHREPSTTSSLSRIHAPESAGN